MWNNPNTQNPDPSWEVERIDEEMRAMAARRQELLAAVNSPQLPAKVYKIAELAYEAGYLRASLEAAYRENKSLIKKVSDQSEGETKLKAAVDDMMGWRSRAFEAEEKLQKLRKRKAK